VSACLLLRHLVLAPPVDCLVALNVGSAVSTLVASAKAQGVDRPAPTASSHQKRRAAERQARVCELATAAPFSCGYCRLSCRQLNSNLLFARVGSWEAGSKIESWEQLKQTKEGVPKQALQAGLPVSTLVASAMAPGVDRPTPTVGRHDARPERRSISTLGVVSWRCRFKSWYKNRTFFWFFGLLFLHTAINPITSGTHTSGVQ